MESSGSTDNREVLAELSAAHAEVTSAQRRLLEVVARCARDQTGRSDGSGDLAEWLSARLGISNWAARRWIGAAHALGLPSCGAHSSPGPWVRTRSWSCAASPPLRSPRGSRVEFCRIPSGRGPGPGFLTHEVPF